MTDAKKITLAQAAEAFEQWENDYRKDPNEFMTGEEAAAMEVAPLSEQRAITLFAYLRQNGA